MKVLAFIFIAVVCLFVIGVAIALAVFIGTLVLSIFAAL